MKTLDQALEESEIYNYSAVFQMAVKFCLEHETEFQKGHHGDYDFVRTENVPGDNGGRTRFGIDARSHPGVGIANLDLNGALRIYYDEWEQHALDQLPDKLAIAAFDVWVNGGHANVWLQHAYNETNPPDSEELDEDGQLGPASLAALNDCDEDEVLRVFIEQRQARFNRLARRADFGQFLSGWTARNEDLARLLT